MDIPVPSTRRAQAADVPAMVGLVHELASYERAAEHCRLTERQLHEAMFGPRPALFGHVALVDGEVVGCALWFVNFSTWQGAHGIYVEDLYVQPRHRGTGLGRSLLRELAHECVRQGYGRLEWSVLDWNEPAIGFYKALGAQAQAEWTTYRLSGEELASLAGPVAS